MLPTLGDALYCCPSLQLCGPCTSEDSCSGSVFFRLGPHTEFLSPCMSCPFAFLFGDVRNLHHHRWLQKFRASGCALEYPHLRDGVTRHRRLWEVCSENWNTFFQVIGPAFLVGRPTRARPGTLSGQVESHRFVDATSRVTESSLVDGLVDILSLFARLVPPAA